MTPLRPQPVWFGIISGLLLYGSAMVPNSHAYPFLWPLIAGAVAVLLARRGGEALSVADTLRIGGTIGAIATAVALAAAIPSYFLLKASVGAPFARALGIDSPLASAPRALQTLGIGLLLAIPAALIGSAASRPFARTSPA